MQLIDKRVYQNVFFSHAQGRALHAAALYTLFELGLDRLRQRLSHFFFCPSELVSLIPPVVTTVVIRVNYLGCNSVFLLVAFPV